MFGYVMPCKEELSDAEIERYEKLYCGLCHAIGTRYGQCMRAGLTYDMTFLALFLSAFYEPEETERKKRCMVHPKKARQFVQNRFVEYAADMTVLLVHHKCMDDWVDDKNTIMRLYASVTGKAFDKARQAHIEKANVIDKTLSAVYEAERVGESPSVAADAFGQLVGELFAYKKDDWEKPMRQFGMALGQFIYMLDAVMDYEKDKKRGRYNPLLLLDKKPNEMKDTLSFLIGRAAMVFEKMPIVQDAELVRNILYKGVWQKYALRKRGDR